MKLTRIFGSTIISRQASVGKKKIAAFHHIQANRYFFGLLRKDYNEQIRQGIRRPCRNFAVMQQPTDRRCVVVFDIDGTLCKSNIFDQEKTLELVRKNHPECPIIHWDYHAHVFLPHLQILFDYLLKQAVRIVFFSSAVKERNLKVIPELLASFWGSEKYEALKSEGQFAIFSEDDMRKAKREESGCYKKDLGVVVRDGESLLDVVLVDDDRSFVAHDQLPYIGIMDLQYTWYFEKMEFPPFHYNFAKNSTYYMLGLFKTYFEHEEYKKLPLRDALNQIKPTDKEDCYTNFFEDKHPFVLKMIDVGLLEVQKQVPNAALYDSEDLKTEKSV